MRNQMLILIVIILHSRKRFLNCESSKEVFQLDHGHHHNFTGKFVDFSIGGKDATVREAPFVVQIVERFEDGERTVCTGVLIGPDTVITAQHCFWKADSSGNLIENELRTFTCASDPFAIVYNTARLYTHPPIPWISNYLNRPRKVKIACSGYHHHPKFDFSVLTLRSKVVNSQFAKLDEGNLTCNAPARLYGYGLVQTLQDGDELHQGHVPKVMQVMHTRVYGKCRNGLRNRKRVRTWVKGKSACVGDSGGPLINEATGGVIGILISIDTDRYSCAPGLMNNYVAIAKVAPFIRQYCQFCNSTEVDIVTFDSYSDVNLILVRLVILNTPDMLPSVRQPLNFEPSFIKS